jgi:hypothetical protein
MAQLVAPQPYCSHRSQTKFAAPAASLAIRAWPAACRQSSHDQLRISGLEKSIITFTYRWVSIITGLRLGVRPAARATRTLSADIMPKSWTLPMQGRVWHGGRPR